MPRANYFVTNAISNAQSSKLYYDAKVSRQMWLRSLELAGTYVLEVAEYWNPLVWAIVLSITLLSVAILVYYWRNRKNAAASGQTDGHESTATRSINGEGLDDMVIQVENIFHKLVVCYLPDLRLASSNEQ